MTLLVSIDPGVHVCGLALWATDLKGAPARLVGARLVGARLVEEILDDPTTLARQAVAVARELIAVRPSAVAGGLDLVVEAQQAYDLSRSKGGVAGHNDLIALARASGRIEEAFRAAFERLGVRERAPLPREWKGQVPKPRSASEEYVIARRAEKRLSPEERAAIRLPRDRRRQLDVWDAVGLGLWALGR